VAQVPHHPLVPLSRFRAVSRLPRADRVPHCGHVADNLTVRALGAGDWVLKRDLRLAALRDAPGAFGATLADALARDEAGWRRWGSTGAVFAAFSGGRPVGLAGGVPADGDPTAAELFSMWVDPDARGRGVAAALTDAVVGWARGRGYRRVWLEVASGNDTATRTYARYGFAPSTRPPRTGCGSTMDLTLAD
jgi:GNAT superfamily N-acetyltransferase